MHTSGMKLTSLFLSLMLAGSALGAPLPASGVPGFNPPTLGSDAVPSSTMDQVNAGLKGKSKPPQEKTDDPITDATNAAANGNAVPAKGLGPREVSDLAALLGDADLAAAILGGDADLAAAILDAGNGATKRSAGPPSVSPAGIRAEIDEATTRRHKRSEGVPLDGDVDVAAILAEFLGDDVGAESLGERSPVDPPKVLDGVSFGKNADAPTTADVKAIAKGVVPAEKREVDCVKKVDAKGGNPIGCVSDAVGEKIDPNKLNGVGSAATGKTQPPKTGTETVTDHDASDADVISTFAPGVRARDEGAEAVAEAVHLAGEGKKIVGGGDVASLTTPLGGKKASA